MSAKCLEPSGGLKSSPKREGHPIKVGVSVKLYHHYWPDQTATVSGWLHVTWLAPEFPKIPAETKYEVRSLRDMWRPDIRVLNSLSNADPLLSDDTKVRIGHDGDVKAVVRLQCRVPVTYMDLPRRCFIQIRLGSLLISAEDMVFEVLKEAVDLSGSPDLGYPRVAVVNSVRAVEFNSKNFTDDGVYSSIIITLHNN